MRKSLKILLVAMTSSIVLFLIVTLLIPYLKFKWNSSERVAKGEIMIVGHRGAAALAPENTMASFEKALEIEVDIIELDIHLTKDGQVVVIHDANVSRTTSSEGNIEDLTLDELNHMDAGSWFDPKYGNEKIPTLEEVLDLIDGRCKLMIEIKWPRKGIYEGIVDKMLQIVNEKKAVSWVIVQSFEPEYLRQVSERASDIELHQLVFGLGSILPVYFDRSMHIGKFSPEKGVSSVNMYYIYLSQYPNGQSDHKTGVFTVNEDEDIKSAIALGATYIISDRPDLVKSVIGR